MKDDYPKIYLYKRIVQAKLFIDKNYFDKIDLDNISDESYFSKYHFIRLFKTTYGKTPHKYLTIVRIEKAKLLLKKRNTVIETCFAVGFESSSSFTGLFKRIVGLTPSEFQKKEMLRESELVTMPLKYIPNCFAENKGWTKNSNFQEVT
ncbi:helix-turn-helix domain-containing protein [Aequorivita antarctica]|jgi:AraC-like DNA-binding protein|uniref:Helix-turn-helix transcriptional regulator n=1 Tax=Aequorivita antarctica TaxID=153266 RepID=A0A5C6YUK6_9FLAO|nr:AraC family transcriptional regulator [Aequorivita antarctica]TXD71263.1 helix-turn-helix transcriptional regulator [Aequorivita antarctica]SRX76530.1 Bifunctional transcriptional activator/DNA repair enzyme AdaA [Aequorivita antarctica]